MSENNQNQLELRSDREKVASYIVGFLKSFQQACLPHQSLNGKNASPEIISCALAHLQVFSVRALETFFRDCFVLLCKQDPLFLAKATEATKGKIDYATLSGFISGKSSLEDHLAAQRNFQNLDVVNLAFEPLFGDNTFDALNKVEFHPLIPGNPPRTIKISLKDKPWRPLLYELVNARHQIIHNSNHPLPCDQGRVLEQANMALLVGQLFGSHLANKLGVGTLVTEAPLWMVALTAVAMKSDEKPEVLMSRIAKELSSNPDLKEMKGHIGPAIVLGKDLMRIRFTENHAATNAFSDSTCVIHLLNRVGEDFELQTLQGVRNTEGKCEI